jgi:hypothetical protein
MRGHANEHNLLTRGSSMDNNSKSTSGYSLCTTLFSSVWRISLGRAANKTSKSRVYLFIEEAAMIGCVCVVVVATPEIARSIQSCSRPPKWSLDLLWTQCCAVPRTNMLLPSTTVAS